MKEELKACPFCGENTELHTIGARSYGVICMGCASGTRKYLTRQEVIKQWNTRAEPKQGEDREEIYDDLALFFNKNTQPWSSAFFKIYKALKACGYIIIKEE